MKRFFWISGLLILLTGLLVAVFLRRGKIGEEHANALDADPQRSGESIRTAPSGGPIPFSPWHGIQKAPPAASGATAFGPAAPLTLVPPPGGPSRAWRWPEATWTLVKVESLTPTVEKRHFSVHAPHERYPHLLAEEAWIRDAKGNWQLHQEIYMIADHVLLKAQAGIEQTTIEALAAKHDCELRTALFAPDHYLVSFAEPGREALDAALDAFEAEVADISIAEPDYLRFATLTPNDPFYTGGQEWGAHNTGQNGGTVDVDYDGPESWDITVGGSDVIVGIIDSGVQINHPDIIDNLYYSTTETPGNNTDDDGNGLVDDINGWDFYSGDNDPSDESGHGTHVAGTVAAEGNNGIGVAGVSWNAKLMGLRFLGPAGSGPTSAAINCVYYARSRLVAGEPVRITNNSWGGGGFSSALQTAITAAENSGQLFVAAAGNDNINMDVTPDYPAAYNNAGIISVANITRTGARSGSSNYGLTTVDLGAPGTTIISTYPGSSYAYLSGTSMASPQVAGAAAVLFSLDPTATWAEVKAWILDGAKPLASMNGVTVTGDMLSLYNAIQQAGLRVSGSVPAIGSVLSTPPTTFVLNLSGNVDAATVQASDLQVNGISANSVVVNTPQQLTFSFATSPVTTQGAQTMSVAAAAFTRSDSVPVAAWTGIFRYDVTPLQVTSTAPVDTSVVPLGFSTLDLNWNEAIAPASVDVTDLALSQGSVVAAVAVSSTLSRYTLSGVSEEGLLSVDVAAGAVTDTFGNDCLTYAGSFTVDRTTASDVGSFEALLPWGGMVHRRQNMGILHDASDTDSWLVSLRAGQVYSALVEAEPGVAWSLELLDSGSVSLASSTGSSGQAATLPATTISAAGSYTLVVSGNAAGSYVITDVLNASAAAGAALQSLAASAIETEPANRLSREAGYGQLTTSDSVHEFSVGSQGTVAVALRSGAITASLIATSGGATLDTADLTVDEARFILADYGNIDARVRVSGDGAYVVVQAPADAFNAVLHDTIATAQVITNDALGGFFGSIPALVSETEPNDDGVLNGSLADLELAEDLRGDFVSIAAGQYRATVTGTVDPGFDEDWDFFRFHARPGDSLTLELWGLQSGRGTLEDPTVRLYDRNGIELAINDDIVNGVQRESRLTYTSFAYDGDYYAVADSWDFTTGTYEMWVTLTAADIFAPATEDVYAINLQMFDALTVDLHVPDFGPSANALSPTLRLEDVNGTLLGGPGFTYVPAAAETVYARVQNTTGNFGEYVLLASNVPATVTMLEVISAHSTATPPVGTNILDIGTSVTATVSSPIVNGGTQLVASGWTGSGDVPASGGSASTSFTLNQPSSITWNWQTNVSVAVTSVGSGTVSGTTGWVAIGTSLSFSATPAPFHDFVGWSGDASGTNSSIIVAANGPLNLTATFQIQSFDLTVASQQGTATPAAGLHSYPAQTSVAPSILPPVDPAGIQHTLLGWTGTGDVPAMGSSSNVSAFSMTQDSSITWLWQTQALVTASAQAGGTVDASGGWLNWGTTLTVHAAPSTHFDFAGWIGDSSGASITGPQITLPVDGPRAVEATFTRKQYALTVNSDPNVVLPASGTYSHASESVHLLQASTNRVFSAGTETLLAGWTGTGSVPASGTSNQVSISLDQASSISWLWQTNHFLDASSQIGGSIDVASGFRADNSSVTITATATTHYEFTGWTGDLGGANPAALSLTLTMDQARTVVATYARKLYTLSVVTAQGASLPAVGVYTLSSESTQSVALAASSVTNAGVRHTSLGWLGSGSIGNGSAASTGPFILTAPSSVTWLWDTNYYLTASAQTGGSIDQTSAWQADQASVTLTATPNTFYAFTGWTGDVGGANPASLSLTLTMDQARTVQATFIRQQHALSIVSAHGSTTPAIGSYNLLAGTTQAVDLVTAAITNAGVRHTSLGWLGSGSIGNGSAASTGPFVLTAPSSVTWLWETNYYLSASAQAGGTIDQLSGWQVDQASLTLTATPSNHFSFTGWTGDLGGASPTQNPITLTMDQARSLTASFTRNTYDLTIVSPYGSTLPSIGVHPHLAETTHSVGVNSTVVTAGTTRHTVTGWTGSGALASGSGAVTGPFILTAPTTVTWLWQTDHFLDVSSSAGGSIDAADGWLADGSSLSITATPAAHHVFVGWTGDLGGASASANPLPVTMDQGRSLTATFQRLDYSLAVTSAHGTTTPAPGLHLLASESPVSVSVSNSPDVNGGTRYLATGWLGTGVFSNGSGLSTPTTSLTLPSTVTILWETQHLVTVQSDAGLSASTTTAWHSVGSSVTVLVTEQPHFEFAGWTGDLSGASNSGLSVTVPVDGPRTIIANANSLGYNLTVSSPYGTANPAVGVTTYASLSSVSASMTTPLVTLGQDRHSVTGWTATGALASGTGSSTGPFTLTGDTSVSWLWDTEHKLDLSVTGSGSLDTSSAWHNQGAVVTVTASTVPHHDLSWTGDLGGTTPSGNSLTIPMNQGRRIEAVYTRRNYALNVVSAHGSTVPAVGTTMLPAQSSVTVAQQAASVTAGSYRYDVVGWLGSGSAPSGNGTSAGPFVLNQPSTVSWLWNTNVYIDVSAASGGSVNPVSGWYALGDSVTAIPSPTTHYQFAAWTGDTAGTTPGPGGQLLVPADVPRELEATFTRRNYTLTIASEHGSTTPALGAHAYASETPVSVALSSSSATTGGTRVDAAGYIGTGIFAAGGSATSVGPVSLTSSSSLTFLWDTNYFLTVQSSTGGSVAESSAWHPAGSSVTLNASASTHFQFSHWQGDLAGATMSGSQITVLMSQAKSIQAVFSRVPYTFTVASPRGTASPAVGVHTYDSQSAVSASMSPTQITSGSTRYDLQGWTGSGSLGNGSGATAGPFSIAQNSAITWEWRTSYRLDLSAQAGGSVSGTTGWFVSGQQTTLIAAPAFSYFFAGWDGDLSGTTASGNNLLVPMDQARTISARFTQQPYELTISSPFGSTSPALGTNVYIGVQTLNAAVQQSPLVSGDTRQVVTGWNASGAIGSGTGDDTGDFVLDQPTTINWEWRTDHFMTFAVGPGGSINAASQWVAEGSSLSLTATASAQYEFDAWVGDVSGATISGNQMTLPADAPRRVEARFRSTDLTLSIASPVPAVSPAPGSSVLPANSVRTFAASSPYDPIANDGARQRVTGWTGSGSIPASGSSATTGPIALTADSSISWQWLDVWELTTQVAGQGTVSAGGWFDTGSSASLTASPATGYQFVEWQGDLAAATINGNQLALPMTQAREVTAVFSPIQVMLMIEDTTETHPYGTSLSITADPAQTTLNGVRETVTGWLGTGSVPFTGTGASIPSFILTQASNISWLRQIEYLLTVSGGTTSGGWYGSGASVVVSAVVPANQQFVRWVGDVSPAQSSMASFVLSMTRARSISAEFAPVSHAITVTSDRGTPSPAIGVSQVAHGTVITPTMAESVIGDSQTRYVDPVWNGSGSLTVTAPVRIDWSWTTQHQLTLATSGSGTLNRASSFVDAGAVTLTPTAAAYHHFVRWSDGSTASPYVIDLQSPQRLTAEFAVNLSPAGIPETWFAQNGVAIDDAADPDGDGVSNVGEWQAGTHPDDAAEFPRIADCKINPATGLVMWPSKAGHVYRLETSTHPDGPFNIVLDAIPATPPENQIALPAGPQSGWHIFRIITSRE